MSPSVVDAQGCDALYRRMQALEVQRRVEFLDRHQTLSCAAARLRLQASGLSPDAALAAVRTQRQLFYVQFIDVVHFPAFQWRHVMLREVIGDVLAVFEGRKSKWQIARWFTTTNDALSLRPIDLLDDDPVALISAARDDVGIDSRNH